MTETAATRILMRVFKSDLVLRVQMNPLEHSDRDGDAEVEDGEQEQYAAYAHACMRYTSPPSIHVTFFN